MLATGACRSLGQLKFEAAIPKLKEPADEQEQMVAMAAIDALKQMDVISSVDAAVAKLKTGGYLQQDERDLVARPKTRAVSSR